MARTFTSFTHNGRLEGGKLVANNPKWFRGMLSLYKDCNVVITVERRTRGKSREQQGYYWGVVLPYIAEHTGHTTEELHDIFKAMFLRSTLVWRGTETVVVGSTKTLTSSEMAEYLTDVLTEAADLGIEVPQPDKLYQFKT